MLAAALSPRVTSPLARRSDGAIMGKDKAKRAAGASSARAAAGGFGGGAAFAGCARPPRAI